MQGPGWETGGFRASRAVSAETGSTFSSEVRQMCRRCFCKWGCQGPSLLGHPMGHILVTDGLREHEGASAWTNTTTLGETLAEMSPDSISCALVPILCHLCRGGFAIGTKTELMQCHLLLPGHSWTLPRTPLVQTQPCTFPGAGPGLEWVWELR